MKSTHRIGSITFGIALIGFGIAFLLHTIIPAFSLSTIVSLWPVILIILGLEVLASTFISRVSEKIIYDKVGIFMTALLIFFAMGMGLLSFFAEYAVRVYH